MKIILRLSIIAFLLVDMGVCSLCGTAIAGSASMGPAELSFVEEWEKVSAADANIAVMSKEQILAEVQKGLEAQKALDSWEAKYCVTSRQAPQIKRDRHIPEIITTSHVRIISNDTKWFYESKQETEDKTAKEKWAVNHRIASNGKVISMVWPDRNEAMVQSKDQTVGIGVPKLVDFLPSLPTEPLAQAVNLPEVLEILDDPDTQLLPWYTRVGGHTCYILEQITTQQQPIFKSKEEADHWIRKNPAKGTRTLEINPSAKPGDERVAKTKVRLAINPQFSFAIVRWAEGYEVHSPIVQINIFPKREIIYTDFHRVAEGIYIPWQMAFKDFHGMGQVSHETQLQLEEFAVNKQYEPKLFEFDLPKGYNIIDQNRGIVYTVGDSKGKIDTLIAAAKVRNEFYKKLSQTQAPSLEPSEWLNSAPIVLAEQKGRPIIIYFWSLGCAPCMHELPRLQKEYGRTLELASGPLFISIHPFVDGRNLSQLKKVIKKYGITFPVMVDSAVMVDWGGIERPFWGKTFKKYRVDAVPTEVSIDENGHFAEIDEELITTSSWWMENRD